ncbi:hypothetical protein K1F50_01360 [Muricauda oceani]|uniref:Uncharacterized protein n=1 Tax=Flagellimonas oceani TaxID=2698672 RepID=A0A6G7J1Z2_9FLAO|nr:hypothetical protein [Allomuricauda oceani]MBW8241428.1 hypothetical protein [Allomuricauda oceani]QII44574.1 hypothetical protein GVT53_07750 [Allomuricauda oceani]
MIQPSKKRLFPVLLFLVFSALAFGQDRKTYEGPLQVGPYSGKALYQFVISDLDTIYDGDFQLQQSNLETLVENEDTSFRFSGGFDKGEANGPWEFEFGEYKTNSQSQVVGYEYRVLVSGVQQIGEGNLVDGKPDGTWTYTINQIKDSEIEKIVFKSSISFDEGVPRQNFQIENDSSVLVGRFLRDGLAHDEWSFYGTEAVEELEDWFFEDGLLRTVKIKSEGKSQEINVFAQNPSNYKTVTLDEGYLTLLKTVVQLESRESQIVRLLDQNMGYYQKVNSVLDHLGTSDFKTNMKVRVPHYPLDSVQDQTLDKIVSEYGAASKMSTTILKNSHLNIVKRTDPEALFYYNAAKKINSDFLVPLSTLVAHRELGIIQYQEIPELLKRLWPNGKPGPEIIAVADEEGNTRVFSLPSSKEFEYESNDLLAVEALATYAKMSLEFIKGSLASRLTNEEQLQMLNGLEEELIELNNDLEQELDSVPGLSSEYKGALKQLKNVADSSLTNYADLKKPDEKLEYGKRAKTCLAQLSNFAVNIKKLPQHIATIEKEYTNAVWNPFMANVMEEDVKKRIVSAYKDILIPYFIKTATEELTCDNIATLNEQMMNTHQSILDLRNKDTRKLERKLRREKRPKEVLALILEQSTLKNQ